MKTSHTDITVILDRSGSMASVADDTIGGFNTFLHDQQKAPGTATITLHQFDDVFETPIKATDIKSAPDLTSKTFVPRGSTAMLDAIGRGITDTGSRLENTAESDRPEKVVFVIITDGHENASHEFSYSKIFDMIKHQREKYSWEFVFLGANIDAKEVAGNIGVNVANAIKYAHNAAGTQAVFRSASSNLRSYREDSIGSMAFSADDYSKQADAGVDPFQK